MHLGIRGLLVMMGMGLLPMVLQGVEPCPGPHFVVMVADDLGYGDRGCFGA